MKSRAISSWLPCCPLGSGSSALVCLAISLSDGLPFALKSPLSPSSSPSLLNELRILLRLSSPLVLQCFGAQFDASNPCSPRHLFLEFMDGGSLSSLLKRSGGRLKEPLARHYARSIVQGLEYLHNNGVVHCDIKCQNILIGSSGVKIADFGAAKRMGEEGGATIKENHFRGTPLWMAPEVARGFEQGIESDIWSLGCTVVELLQGRPPLGHVSDISAALYKLACSEDDVPLPSTISDDARDFLHHCLQRDPKARWSASQLLQHPFLCNMPSMDELKHDQLSPRSTLNFMQNDVSDSEDMSDSNELPTFCFQSVAKPEQEVAPSESHVSTMKRQFAEAFVDLYEHEWITVKKTTSYHRKMSQMPFMKSEYGHVTKGYDVSLEAAKFLSKRKIVG